MWEVIYKENWLRSFADGVEFRAFALKNLMETMIVNGRRVSRRNWVRMSSWNSRGKFLKVSEPGQGNKIRQFEQIAEWLDGCLGIESIKQNHSGNRVLLLSSLVFLANFILSRNGIRQTTAKMKSFSMKLSRQELSFRLSSFSFCFFSDDECEGFARDFVVIKE